jgi:hypothetical protein
MRITVVAAILLAAATLSAQSSFTVPAETLLDRAVLKALDEELSGVAAKDHVSRLTQLHRVPASPGFHEAIDYVMTRAKAAGLGDAHVETFPGNGTAWFGTLHGNRGTPDGSMRCGRSRGGSFRTTTSGSQSPTTARAQT